MRSFWLALPALLLAAPAAAQTSPVGQWQCNEVSRSPVGDPAANWIYSFALAVGPDGSFQAQGTYGTQITGITQRFVAQGGWRATSEGLVFQGQKQMERDPGGSFLFVITQMQGNMMANTYRSPSNLLQTSCQRTG